MTSRRSATGRSGIEALFREKRAGKGPRLFLGHFALALAAKKVDPGVSDVKAL